MYGHCSEAERGMYRLMRRAARQRFGGFGPHWGGGAGRHGGFRANRLLNSADLQLLVLLLLREQPRHGYEIIKALEERTSGFYVPSPGVIYPALSYLEEIGYATVTPEGAKKLYSITEEGRKYLADNQDSADVMMAELVRVGERMARARQHFADDEPAAGEDAAYSGMRAARRNLRAALEESAGASGEEIRRIVEILNHAAREIRGA
jgi:DNA-binding PadR family transcriptional regulator